MTTPLRPEHADKTMAVPGASARFSMTRHLEGYAYPQNGNVHNPTPIYRWLLKLDGRLVDHSTRQHTIVHSARVIGVKGYEDIRAAGTAVETVTRPAMLDDADRARIMRSVHNALEQSMALLDILCDDAQHADRCGQQVPGANLLAKSGTNVEIALDDLADAMDAAKVELHPNTDRSK